MQEAARVTNIEEGKPPITDYVLGDMSSTVYPVNGGLEDWAYGASWDTQGGGTVDNCDPKTYPLSADGIDQSD